MRAGLIGLGLIAAAAALSWAAGCGGDVVVDGGSGGEAATSSGTTSTMTSTGTGDPTTTCEAFCQRALSVGCAGGTLEECMVRCADLYDDAGMCSPELTALLVCLTSELPPSCEIVPPCLDLSNILEGCQGGGCGPSTCVSGDQECTCDQTCNDRLFTSACKSGADGAFSCECLVDGMVVGNCQESGEPCNIQSGCCSQFFGL